MSDRTPRELETRTNTERKRTWSPPSLLPNPRPEDGYGFRYVRKSMMGQEDETNMLSKQEEGWVPVRREDHPELQTSGKTTGLVEIGGLVLCKMPSEMIDQRNAYYRRITDAQTASVDSNLMKENDPRMPLFSERKSTSSRGRRGD